jgi:hypothetical protein
MRPAFILLVLAFLFVAGGMIVNEVAGNRVVVRILGVERIAPYHALRGEDGHLYLTLENRDWQALVGGCRQRIHYRVECARRACPDREPRFVRAMEEADCDKSF